MTCDNDIEQRISSGPSQSCVFCVAQDVKPSLRALSEFPLSIGEENNSDNSPELGLMCLTTMNWSKRSGEKEGCFLLIL